MTPARIAALLLSIAALVGAAALVFGGVGVNGEPTGTTVAVLPSAATPGAPTSVAPPTSGATGAPASAVPTDLATASPTPTAPPNPLAKQVPPTSVAPEDLGDYIWPVRHALITSRFAPREAALGGFVIIDGEAYHDGLDLATHCNDKVRAAHGGTVLYAGRNFDPYVGYLGNAAPIYARLEQLGRVNTQPIVVVIDDGNGYRSEYVHLNEADVEAGQVVQAGDVIGLEGATGYATGCHLHYTMIRADGGWQQVVPRLAQFGYPPLVRERIDPLDVLPWGDEYAPQRLQDKVNPPTSPSPAPTEPSAGETPGATPTTTPGPAEPSQSPAPTTP